MRIDPRSTILVSPGWIQVGALATANVIINLPSWVCLVEKIAIQVDDLDMTINIRRSDAGAQTLTQGGVAASLLGATVLDTIYYSTIRIGSFICDKNTVVTLECTDLSNAANDVFVGIYTRFMADDLEAYDRAQKG